MAQEARRAARNFHTIVKSKEMQQSSFDSAIAAYTEHELIYAGVWSRGIRILFIVFT